MPLAGNHITLKLAVNEEEMVNYLPKRYLYSLHITNYLERHNVFLTMAFQESEKLVDREDI